MISVKLVMSRIKDILREYVGAVYESPKRLFHRYILPYRLPLILVTVLVVMFFRDSALLLHPQLWAEDGQYFFADAYNHGARSLLWTYAGFYQTFDRAVALLATQVSIVYIPYLFAAVSMLTMLLPVFIIWSDESILFGDTKRKYLLLITVLYVLMPFHSETLGNIANCGWYLAIAAALVLIRRWQTAKKWRWFDYLVLAIAGLTGPYALLLIGPALFLKFTAKKDTVLSFKCFILVACACIQLFGLSTYPPKKVEGYRSQAHTVLHAKKRPFQVAAMRLVVEPLTHFKAPQPELAYSDQLYLAGILVGLLGLAAFIKADQNLKALLLFVFISYVVMLFRALNDHLLDHFNTMAMSNLGARYLVIPFFGWVIALAVLAMQKSGRSLVKHAAVTLLAAYTVILPLGYHMDKLPDTHYRQSIQHFSSLNAGVKYCIPEDPGGWYMCLRKK